MAVRKDWTDQRFGRRVFVRPTDDKAKDGSTIWEALCDCGSTTYVVPGLAIKSKNISCGCIRDQTPNDFWARMQKGKEDECWLWQGTIHESGYGVLGWYGKQWKAHRLAYYLIHGEIEEDMFICHSCDTPLCCSPKHLFSGTPNDNTQDMVNKERQARGEKNSHAILTSEQVKEIRAIYAKEDVSFAQLGRMFGVSYQTIQGIITRRIWKHID